MSSLRALAAVFTLTAVATAAHADEAVSQINGQLVKVGEHNEYVYSFKRWNVSANPIGWMLGAYGVSLSYGINDQIAVRGDVNYYRPVGTDVQGYEIGVGLPIYFRRTYSGLFLEPGLVSRGFNEGGRSVTSYGPQVLVGWHWTWDSGLNVAVAAGLGRDWSVSSDQNDSYVGGYSDTGSESEYPRDTIFPNGYLRFGYSF